MNVARLPFLALGGIARRARMKVTECRAPGDQCAQGQVPVLVDQQASFGEQP